MYGKVFKDEYISHYFEMHDRKRDVLLDGRMNVITIEAEKIKGERIGNFSRLERWGYWFRYAGDKDKREQIKELKKEDGGIEMADKVRCRRIGNILRALTYIKEGVRSARICNKDYDIWQKNLMTSCSLNRNRYATMRTTSAT